MALWAEKYRPRDLRKLLYHQDEANKMSKMVSAGDFPHFLFCGPPGAGKRTLIHCLLRKIYSSGVQNLHMETQEFVTPGGKKLQIYVANSNYHIELTPSDAGFYDRLVVTEVIKGAAETQQLLKGVQKPFKVVVLLEADGLTKEAQHALRRTMEKYASTCKIILCCESSSRIIDPLRSRCMVIRVPAPSDEEMKACISYVVDVERLMLSDRMMKELIVKADGNTRRALLLLEGTVSQYGTTLDNQPLMEPEWENYLCDTATLASKKQSPEGVLEVRQRLYEMLCRCIPTSVIFSRLTEELIKTCNPSIVSEVISEASKYEHTSKLGSKDILHLEAFIVSYMDICSKNSVTKPQQKKQKA